MLWLNSGINFKEAGRVDLKKDNFNKFQIGLSAGSHFATDIYQSFYIGLIPLLTLKFGLSLFEVSLLSASSIIANSLFSPIFGYLSDRQGLKYYMIAGPLFTSIFLSIAGILPNFYLILVFLFIGNLSIAAFHPASAAIAGHYGGRKKGMGSSLINFGGNFGNAAGALLAILIVVRLGLNFTPIAMIPGILMAFILFKYIPSSTSSTISAGKLNLFKKARGINKIKLCLLLIIMFSAYSLYVLWITLVTYISLYYTAAGVSLVNIGTIIFLYGALSGAGGFLSGYLFDHYKKGSYIIQAGFLIATPLIFFTFKSTSTTSIILFIASGFFMVAVQPVCIRMAQDLFPKNISLASSLVLGLSPGLAAITMIFLGKAADIIGIAALVNYELFLFIFTILLLFSYPLVKKHLRKK